jgi:hypothetical protein
MEAFRLAAAALLAIAGCGGHRASGAPADLSGAIVGDLGDGALDALPPADSGAADLGPIGCEWGGAPGVCLALTACAAIADHSSEAGSCPGPTSIQCCIVTPDVADDPPVPAGYQLMAQAQVTAAMTTWAVAILDDPTDYPMFATTTQTFGTQLVLARVEWHPPDFQNSVVHRGVTLYVPI